MQDVLPLLDLPKALGEHPDIPGKQVVLDVSFRSTTVAVEGYPYKSKLPEDLQLSDVWAQFQLEYTLKLYEALTDPITSR